MKTIFKLLKLDQYPEMIAYLTVMAMVGDLALGFMLTAMGKLVNLMYPMVFIVLLKLTSNLTHVLAITPLYKRVTTLGAFKATVLTTSIAMVSCILVLIPTTRFLGVTVFVLGNLIHTPFMSVFKNKISRQVASYHGNGFDIGTYNNHKEVLMCVVNIVVGITATILLLPSLLTLDLSQEVQMLNVYDEVLLKVTVIIGFSYVAFRAYVVRKISKYITEPEVEHRGD